MVRGNSQKPSNGSALDFEAQLWAAAEQAVPTANLEMTEYNGARPEGLCLGLISKDVLGRVYEYEKFASAPRAALPAEAARSPAEAYA